MFNSIQIGRYYPTHSPLHKSSIFLKIIGCFLFFLTIWLVKNPFLFLLIGVELFLLCFLSRIPFSVYGRMLKGSLLLLICYNGINVLFGVSLPFLLMMNGKVLLSIFLSAIFLFTTRPFDLNQGLELIFSPLEKIHIPVSYVTFSMILLFRFLPLIMETFNTLVKALVSAGCSLYESSWKEKLNYVKTLFVPLFYLSFQKSDAFAELLEIKLFDLNEKRSYYHELTWKWSDFLFYLFLIVQLFVVLVVR